MTPPRRPALTRDADAWALDEGQFVTVARNVGTRYLVIAVDSAIGLLMLPFNLGHLGESAYGLWVLTASITTYFTVLDLGYGGALVKFVAQYRAWRDRDALNEILSTMFFVLLGVGALAYAVTVGLAFNLGRLFNITPEQAELGKYVLLMIGLHASCAFAFSIFGGVINGFQRYYLNNIVGTVTSVIVAAVNVAVLASGHGLVALVAATTCVRLLGYGVYRWNAYSVFPDMRIRPSSFRKARLKEVTGFSIYTTIIDWANKLNYATDSLVIAAFLNSAAVAMYAIPLRLSQMLMRLTSQVSGVLFPVVVDSDAGQRTERLRLIFLQGTRLSLACVIPFGLVTTALADPLIRGWVGSRFGDAVVLLQILTIAMIFRVGNSMSTTVLKGAGQHRRLAFWNIATALVNLALSLLWVRRYGLVGVAMGTLVPVALTSTCVMFPMACRRVGVTLSTAWHESIWPAIWPGVVIALLLAAAGPHVNPSLLVVGALGAGACAAYFALFLGLAVGRRDRRLYTSKAGELLRWKPRVQAVA